MISDNSNQPDGKLIFAHSPKDIDWDAMHSVQTAKTPFFKKDVSCWDKYAISPTIGEIDQSYIDQLMPRLSLSLEMSAMDVGCGNGGISMALAEHVKQVTALDISPAALDSLRKKVKEANRKNINIVKADFSQIEIGKDIKKCDMVLASRSLPMGNLKRSLIKINSAARQLCYVVCGSSDNELTKWICSKVGISFRSFPEYIITLNLLYSMDIHANLEIFNVEGTYRFCDINEALFFAMFGYEIKDKSTGKEIKKLVRSRLIPEYAGYKYNYRKQFALIWWEK